MAMLNNQIVLAGELPTNRKWVKKKQLCLWIKPTYPTSNWDISHLRFVGYQVSCERNKYEYWISLLIYCHVKKRAISITDDKSICLSTLREARNIQSQKQLEEPSHTSYKY